MFFCHFYFYMFTQKLTYKNALVFVHIRKSYQNQTNMYPILLYRNPPYPKTFIFITYTQ